MLSNYLVDTEGSPLELEPFSADSWRTLALALICAHYGFMYNWDVDNFEVIACDIAKLLDAEGKENSADYCYNYIYGVDGIVGM